MNEQQILRAHSSEIRDVEGWVMGEWTVGVRFVILEGLMGSGKATLTKQPFSLGPRWSANIELDRFLPAPVNHDLDYMDAINVDAATAAMKEALRVSPLVVAEGPVAWPVAQHTLQEVPGASNSASSRSPVMNPLISKFSR